MAPSSPLRFQYHTTTFVEETARDVFFFSDGKSNARTKANKIFVQLQPITGRISLVYISLKSTLNLHPGPTAGYISLKSTLKKKLKQEREREVYMVTTQQDDMYFTL